MTVLEVIQQSSEYLARHGVESPRLNVELLLGHVLGLPRLKLYLNFERVLLEAELEPLRGLLRRRSAREPLQHILGTTSFCGHEIHVNNQVLVPRQETELLAEHAWTWLNAQPSLQDPFQLVLDFGTGSGCLAVAIAAACPNARVHALDCSPQALEVATRNAATHALQDRVQTFCGDGFNALPGASPYRLIVSNPPYIPRHVIPTLQPEVRNHDPWLALDGGPDGLDFYRLLARDAPAFLHPQGRLMVEFGDGQDQDVRKLLSTHGWEIEAVHADYNRVPRIGIARRSV